MSKIHRNELERRFFLKSNNIRKKISTLDELIIRKIARQATTINFDKNNEPIWDENVLSNILISYDEFFKEIDKLIETLNQIK